MIDDRASTLRPRVSFAGLAPCSITQGAAAIGKSQHFGNTLGKCSWVSRCHQLGGSAVLEDLGDLTQRTGDDRTADRHVFEDLRGRPEELLSRQGHVRRNENVTPYEARNCAGVWEHAGPFDPLGHSEFGR